MVKISKIAIIKTSSPSFYKKVITNLLEELNKLKKWKIKEKERTICIF